MKDSIDKFRLAAFHRNRETGIRTVGDFSMISY